MSVKQYCAEINEAARSRMELIVPELAKQNGVTEKLKSETRWNSTSEECLQGTGQRNCKNGIDLRLSEEVRAENLFGLFSFLAKVAVELFTGFMV